ncbi:MARVEL domain-containing protein 2 [Merluccius polli]|uniref:MARVEL domain-containing protein 2 n=1 Tax=Merluccius polli TaxID=89951 RepID=A0AA47M5X6_MERPO|nr:MARVEL domain-containing protein 2 [Merluccius polli]
MPTVNVSMRSWSQRFKTGGGDNMAGSSSRSGRSARSTPVAVWVSHTPPPDRPSDAVEVDGVGSSSSSGRTSSTPPYAERQKDAESAETHIKDKLRSLGSTLGSTLRRWTKGREGSIPTGVEIPPDGTRVSPPVSPLTERRRRDGREEQEEDGSLAGSSQRSYKPLLGDDKGLYTGEESVLTSIHPAEYYAEKVEVYKLKYSYLKSWPGLLRLLAGMELLFGGMVIACVIAYVQKDGEWSDSYGMTNGYYNNGRGPQGYSYRGPMTPFVLAVSGLSWVVTLGLLLAGMTMYYRAILLDSAWWPPTEALINVALFLLYMAGGVVYVNDLNRGGLCDATLGLNPLVANLCRVDGGQMAGTAFIFMVMVMYLLSFMVALKMWRHEAMRRERERRRFEIRPSVEEQHHQAIIPLSQSKPKKISFKDGGGPVSKKHFAHQPHVSQDYNTHNHGARVVADYVTMYPEITSAEERERYKDAFNDRYQEYKDLHREISATIQKFQDLDNVMADLLRNNNNRHEQERIQRMLRTYEEKKKDPGFLERRERYMYMKDKLSHIKNRIRTFDTLENRGMR